MKMQIAWLWLPNWFLFFFFKTNNNSSRETIAFYCPPQRSSSSAFSRRVTYASRTITTIDYWRISDHEYYLKCANQVDDRDPQLQVDRERPPRSSGGGRKNYCSHLMGHYFMCVWGHLIGQWESFIGKCGNVSLRDDDVYQTNCVKSRSWLKGIIIS